MKIILALIALLVAVEVSAQLKPNKFDTNTNPESVGWTNTSAAGISGGGGGLTNVTASGLDTHTNLYGRFTPQNMNLDRASVVRSMIISNLNPLVEIITDNSLSLQQPLVYALTNWSRLNGSGGNLSAIGLYFYSTWNSLGTFYPSDGLDPFYPQLHYMLANGGAVTNISATVQGWPTDTIRVRGWKENNFGTGAILTNAYGGAIGTLATIDCDNGGTLAAYSTNFNIPYCSNLVVTFLGSGSNILLDIGQWTTNKFSGIVWNHQDGADYGVDRFFTTAAKSNYFRTFMAGIHGVIATDVAGSNGLYTGFSQLNSMRTSMGETFDVFATTPIGPTNDIPTLLDERRGLLNIAREVGIGVLDTTALFYDQQKVSVWKWMLDVNHNVVNGPESLYIGDIVANWLHWRWEDVTRYGWTNYALPRISSSSGLSFTSTWVNLPINAVKGVAGSVTPGILVSGTDTGSPFFYDLGYQIGSGGNCSFRATIPYDNGSTTTVHRLSFQSAGVSYWTNSIYNTLTYNRTTGRALGSTVDYTVPGINGIITVYMTNNWPNDTDIREALIVFGSSTNTTTRYFINWDYMQR